MRVSVPVAFDHHSKRCGRVEFQKWAESPDAASEPVFRYGRPFAESLSELRSLGETQSDLYLCNLVGHAAVLTARNGFDSRTDLALSYAGVEELIERPQVIGFLVDDDLVADGLKPMQGWQALVGEHSFDESSREAGLTEIQKVKPRRVRGGDAEAVLLCRFTDPERFATNWRCNSFPTFFLPPSVSPDLPVAAELFGRERLRDYLLRNATPFATMGDCHIDDDIAVSYLMSSFDFPESQRCFIR